MKVTGNSARSGYFGAALAAALVATITLSTDPDPVVRARQLALFAMANANENLSMAPQNTTPPARDPEIAVEEEYQIARRRGTAEALKLFIARHPDGPLADKARTDLRRLPR
jgi:hypothetical protein